MTTMSLTSYKLCMMFTVLLGSLFGCVAMHSVQIGEVDGSIVHDGQRFEIKLSAIGFSPKEMGDIAKIGANTKEGEETIDTIAGLVELFQMGPRTGERVADPRFADRLQEEVFRRCPSGQISGLMTVRETADYPGLTGEIVKLVGYCRGGK